MNCCFPRKDNEENVQTSPILYHQVMTPMWIKTHASYLDPTNAVTSQWLSFLTATAKQYPVLFKVPLVQPGQVTDATPLAAEVKLTVDKNIGAGKESDIMILLCDGDDACYGMFTVDKGNYYNHAPCFGTYGSIANHVYSKAGLGPYQQDSSKYSYPAEFVINYKLQERWVSCMPSDSGGFFVSYSVPQQLKPSKGLNLVVVKQDKPEQLAVGMVKVTVVKES